MGESRMQRKLPVRFGGGWAETGSNILYGAALPPYAYHYLDSHPGDLIGLAALLGHRTIEVTRIYVEHTAEELARRVEAGRLNAY
jgi:hypothetical protein